MAQYWHRLRRALPSEERVCWFIRATDLRVGATDSTLFAFKPARLLDDGALTYRGALHGVTDVESGRDWFDWFVAFSSTGTEGRVRFNLGAEETTTRELARRLAGSPSGEPGAISGA